MLKYNCGLIDQPKTTCEEVEAEPAVEKNATGWFCRERFLCSLDFEWSQQQSCSQSLGIVLAVRGQPASFRRKFRHLGVSWLVYVSWTKF